MWVRRRRTRWRSTPTTSASRRTSAGEPGPGAPSISHLPDHRARPAPSQPSFWEERAERWATRSGLRARGLRLRRRASQLRTVQAIVTHLETFPVERARAACRRAQHYGSYTYAGVQEHPAPGARPRAAAGGAAVGRRWPSRPRFARRLRSGGTNRLSCPRRTSHEPTDDLIPILKKLRLSGMLHTLELRTRQAVEDNCRASASFSTACSATRSSVATPSSSTCDCAAPASSPQDARGLRLRLQPEDPEGQDHRPGHLRLRRAQRERAARRPDAASASRTSPRPSATAPAASATPCSTSLRRSCSRSCAPRAPTAATIASCCASPRPSC